MSDIEKKNLIEFLLYQIHYYEEYIPPECQNGDDEVVYNTLKRLFGDIDEILSGEYMAKYAINSRKL